MVIFLYIFLSQQVLTDFCSKFHDYLNYWNSKKWIFTKGIGLFLSVIFVTLSVTKIWSLERSQQILSPSFLELISAWLLNFHTGNFYENKVSLIKMCKSKSCLHTVKWLKIAFYMKSQYSHLLKNGQKNIEKQQ